jgi:hypothetical protein
MSLNSKRCLSFGEKRHENIKVLEKCKKAITIVIMSATMIMIMMIVIMISDISKKLKVQCVRKVAVHLGYGTQNWFSESKVRLKCALWFQCIQMLNSG